jgi:drug/metabolite transporter (DMT)-like permease
MKWKLPANTKFSSNSVAILWMICASFTLACNINITKLLVSHHSSAWIFFLKSIFTVIFLIPFQLSQLKEKKFLFNLPKLYYIRAVLLTGNFLLWYNSLRHIKVNEAIAITYFTPILNILAGYLVFKEKLNLTRVVSIILGFGGVLLILRPGFKEFNIWLYVIVGIAIIWSVIDIICKIQVNTERAQDIVFYNAALVSILSFPYCLSQPWSMLSLKDLALLMSASLFSIVNFYSFLKAYKMGELIVITQVDFLKVVFSLAISYIIFKEGIDYLDLFGIIIMMGATLGLFYQEKN